MAHISKCLVCGQNNINSSYCPECRTIPFENLLNQIQKRLKRYPNKPLPPVLAKTILAGNFRSVEKFKRDKENEDLRQIEQHTKKALRDALLTEHLQKERERFEEKHPDPDPIRFA